MQIKELMAALQHLIATHPEVNEKEIYVYAGGNPHDHNGSQFIKIEAMVWQEENVGAERFVFAPAERLISFNMPTIQQGMQVLWWEELENRRKRK